MAWRPSRRSGYGEMSERARGNALSAGYRLREYRIDGVLGQGGFGITYAATDTALERRVAIKGSALQGWQADSAAPTGLPGPHQS